MKNDFIQKDFNNPSNEYALAPFWFLNDKLEPMEMRRQVREMSEKGVGGAFMHARFGLRTPYFSTQWWEAISAAVDEAKKIGFKLWIYDDMNWSSGWANGEVYKENPDFQEQHLSFVEVDVEGPRHLVHDLPNGWPEYVFVSKEDYSGQKDVTKDIWDWQIVADIPKGKHKLLFFMRRNSGLTHPYNRPAHIDVLNKEATLSFIKHSHQEYKKRFKKEFGKTILGVFTDEPGIYHNLWNTNPLTITWTKKFAAIFKASRGYEINSRLIELWKDVGNFEKTRCDYHETVAEMFSENYFKPIAKWCKENKLQFTGHLEWEETFETQIEFSGHLLKPLRYFDMPGIDKIDREKRRLTEKYISSISHLEGKNRTLSETYALSGWELNFEEMKAVLNWQYVRGVNFMNPHAFYYSIRDERKFECPPSEGPNNIFWPYFKKFSDYTTRASYLVTRGYHKAPALLYYPIYSAWPMQDPDVNKRDDIRKFSGFFETFGITLLENQIDFDIFDDEIILNAEIKEGRIKKCGEDFGCVILAGAEIVPDKTVAALEKFVQGGGLVIINKYRVQSTEYRVKTGKTKNNKFSKILFGNGKGSVKYGKGEIVFADADENVIKTIHEKNLCDVILKEKNCGIKCLHRKSSAWDIYFVVNENDSKINTEIMLRGEGKPYLLDTENGKILKIENFVPENGFIRIPVSLEANCAVFILLSQKDMPIDNVFEERLLNKIVSLDKNWVLTIKGKKIQLIDGLKSWQDLGFPFYSGSAVYKTEFFVPEMQPFKKYFIELGDVKEIAEVKLNGVECGFCTWKPFRIDISNAIHAGKNKLEVKITNTQKNEFEKVGKISGLLGPVNIFTN